jgi:hypothetical protein
LAADDVLLLAVEQQGALLHAALVEDERRLAERGELELRFRVRLGEQAVRGEVRQLGRHDAHLGVDERREARVVQLAPRDELGRHVLAVEVLLGHRLDAELEVLAAQALVGRAEVLVPGLEPGVSRGVGGLVGGPHDLALDRVADREGLDQEGRDHEDEDQAGHDRGHAHRDRDATRAPAGPLGPRHQSPAARNAATPTAA